MAYYFVTKKFGIAVLMLILIQWGCCTNINCDANQCKSLFSTTFKDFFKKGTQRLCRNTDDTIECIDKCLETLFPDFELVNSKTSIVSEVCSYEFQYDLNKHWKCISGHFHRLLTCVSKFGSMTPTDVSDKTLKLLSCKKFLEALNCPYEILQDCDENAVEIINKLFSKVFKASMDVACYTISVNDAYDLPVIYSLSNSYLSTSACLDKLPDVAGNCFTQYLKDFDSNELYHCRNACENHGETCLPSSLMNDFYIPVLSSGKHSCKEDSVFKDKVQLQEPVEDSTISYNSDVVSDVYSKDSITNPIHKNDDHVPSDEAEESLALDSDSVETSTFNYKQNTKEMGNDKVLSTIHSSNYSSSPTPIASSEVLAETNVLSSSYEEDNASENNCASIFENYLQCSFLCFVIVVIFL